MNCISWMSCVVFPWCLPPFSCLYLPCLWFSSFSFICPFPSGFPPVILPLSFHGSFLKQFLTLLITYIHHRHKSSVLIRSCVTLPAVREINDIATSFSHKKEIAIHVKIIWAFADHLILSFIIKKYIRRKWDIVLKFNLLNKYCYSQGLTYRKRVTISPKAHECLSLLSDRSSTEYLEERYILFYISWLRNFSE